MREGSEWERGGGRLRKNRDKRRRGREEGVC